MQLNVVVTYFLFSFQFIWLNINWRSASKSDSFKTLIEVYLYNIRPAIYYKTTTIVPICMGFLADKSTLFDQKKIYSARKSVFN